MASTNSTRSPSYFVSAGPRRIVLAFSLSSSSEERQRAKTDSPMRVTGIPYSSAEIAVHLPAEQ